MRLLLVALCSVCLSASAEDDASARLPALTRFNTEVERVVKHYYPDARIEPAKHGIAFEFNARKFMIHHASKTGEWQDAREEKGPQKGGVLCEMELRAGKWAGAAIVPQTFDYHYFKLLLLAPYSKKHDCCLMVRLSYPSDAKADFIESLSSLANEFEKHLE
jgi:hypothetical protein